MAQKRKSAFQISYVTITYRSVLMGMFGVLLLACVVMYFAFPDTANKLVLSGQIGLGKVSAEVGIGSGGNGTAPDPGPQQAHFTNIDGNVRVRKASTNTWVMADYSLALERGDVVQTSPEGMAKVVFTDGTNYTVKPASLITIQENSVNGPADQGRGAGDHGQGRPGYVHAGERIEIAGDCGRRHGDYRVREFGRSGE